jgi:drug/metabolite transporter (DMT)-like permease
LLFAGLNDVIFKKYSVKAHSQGLYICGIGVVWTFIQALVFILNKESIAHTPATYIFGLIAGLALCLSNVLLLESLKHLDISVGSTIYRLNTIGVVILSVMILNESIDWIKGIGIILGIMAVFILYQPSKRQTEKNRFFAFFVVAIFASFFRAIYGVITKAGISNQANLPTMLMIASSCWIVGGLFYAVVKEKVRHFDLRTSIYSSISGVTESQNG